MAGPIFETSFNPLSASSTGAEQDNAKDCEGCHRRNTYNHGQPKGVSICVFNVDIVEIVQGIEGLRRAIRIKSIARPQKERLALC